MTTWKGQLVQRYWDRALTPEEVALVATNGMRNVICVVQRQADAEPLSADDLEKVVGLVRAGLLQGLKDAARIGDTNPEMLPRLAKVAGECVWTYEIVDSEIRVIMGDFIGMFT